MSAQHLHIICLNVPYPLDMGVNFEAFYKIKALYDAGIKLHVHCFTYDQHVEQPVLTAYCDTIQYYKRSKRIGLSLPYIVSSRINEDLFSNLLKDNYPILMDGVHCSYLVGDQRFKNRNLMVRVLNVEYLYYKGLIKKGSYSFKNLYYRIESRRLRKYEMQLAQKVALSCLSHYDLDYFQQQYGAKNIHYTPLFFPGKLELPVGMGNYCFYHGNLSVPENEIAVMWLLEHVFSQTNTPFVIAGKNPSKKLVDKSHEHSNTCIAENPSDKEMLDLIQKAQINILPSVNATGIKIKLLQALCHGRHCITNSNGAKGFSEDNLFTIADDAATMKEYIDKLMKIPFTEKHAQEREYRLKDNFDLASNAQKLLKWIY